MHTIMTFPVALVHETENTGVFVDASTDRAEYLELAVVCGLYGDAVKKPAGPPLAAVRVDLEATGALGAMGRVEDDPRHVNVAREPDGDAHGRLDERLREEWRAAAVVSAGHQIRHLVAVDAHLVTRDVRSEGRVAEVDGHHGPGKGKWKHSFSDTLPSGMKENCSSQLSNCDTVLHSPLVSHSLLSPIGEHTTTTVIY